MIFLNNDLLDKGDDAHAFREAFSRLSSRGGQIVIDPRFYSLQSPLTVPPGVTITGSYGRGLYGTRLTFAPNCGITLGDQSMIERMSILGQPSSTYQLVEVAGGAMSAILRDLILDGGHKSLWLKNSAYTLIDNVTFLGSTGSYVIVIADGHDVDGAEFRNCRITGHSSSILVYMNGKAHSVKMHQTKLLFGNKGIVANNTVGASSGPKFFYFSDGGFENLQGPCVHLEEADDFKFSNTYFSNDGSADGLLLNMTGSVSIVGSKIRGCGRHGINHADGTLIVNGSSIQNNGLKTAGSGINIGVGATSYTITGNEIGAAADGICRQEYAIINRASASRGTIGNNTMVGNTKGKILV